MFISFSDLLPAKGNEMIRIFILLLFVSSASASILGPVFECRNSEKSFTLRIMSSTEGSVTFKEKICNFNIKDIQFAQGKVSQQILDVLFFIPNCHEAIFYKKGFIKIESFGSSTQSSVYTLALKGHQTFLCQSSSDDIKKLLKLAKEKQ